MNLENRITPKFRESTNFKNILAFLTTNDDTSLAILSDMNNLSSQYGIILDEIGKSLGAYPRLRVPKVIDGIETFFKLDIGKLDITSMINDDAGLYRDISNFEYSRILRAIALFNTFNGTVQEWEDILSNLIGANVRFDIQPKTIGLIVYKDISIIEKKIIEYVLQYSSLTINFSYIGTSEGTPMVLDFGRLDQATFITGW